MRSWDKNEKNILNHAALAIGQGHAELIQFQGYGDDTDSLEIQRLIMLADDLREAIFEFIDSPPRTQRKDAE